MQSRWFVRRAMRAWRRCRCKMHFSRDNYSHNYSLAFIVGSRTFYEFSPNFIVEHRNGVRYAFDRVCVSICFFTEQFFFSFFFFSIAPERSGHDSATMIIGEKDHREKRRKEKWEDRKKEEKEKATNTRIKRRTRRRAGMCNGFVSTVLVAAIWTIRMAVASVDTLDALVPGETFELRWRTFLVCVCFHSAWHMSREHTHIFCKRVGTSNFIGSTKRNAPKFARRLPRFSFFSL